MSQATLFPMTERKARARKTDPLTSWWAANGVDVNRSEALVLVALIQGPATSDDLWERIIEAGHTITSQRVRTALSDMEKRGLAEPNGEYGMTLNGGRSRVWRRKS